jgi:hypothetical protein
MNKGIVVTVCFATFRPKTSPFKSLHTYRYGYLVYNLTLHRTPECYTVSFGLEANPKTWAEAQSFIIMVCGQSLCGLAAHAIQTARSLMPL